MKRLQKKIIIIALIFVMLFIACDIFNPPSNPYSDKILFTSSRSGKDQLYMMNSDGSEITQITNGEYGHSFGRWSPNADRIVCNTEEGYTTIGMPIAVFNSDGSNRIVLNPGSQMAWNPNGQSIVYIYNPSNEIGSNSEYIYTIDPDGGNLNKITNLEGENLSSPCWSSDGEKIIFTSNRHNIENRNSLDIYKMDKDGSNIERLTYTLNGKSYSVAVSNDGSKITFMSKLADSIWASIYISDIDGSNIQLVASPIAGKIYNWPRWSPDDNQILFYAGNTTTPARHYIYMVNIDGTDLHKVISDSSITSCDWSE
jgi:Tol biopolymer transport system component